MFKLRWPAPATVIAMAALFVALGGTGYAVAKLPRNSVGTPQLKKNAVIGSKVKDNALRGADVNEATLGQVPSAANAANAATALNAANADSLDGLDSSAFQRAASQETQHYVIPGGALVDGDSADRDARLSSGRWCGGFGRAATIDFFGAVHLPQGATITGLSVDYIDSDWTTDSNGAVFLVSAPRRGVPQPVPDLAIAPLPTTTPEGGEQTANVPVTGGVGRVVDNTRYAYQVLGAINADFAYICAVDVAYTLPAG